MLERTILQVPVDGGELTVARWGRGDAIVLAPHGITANHVSWTYIAEELGDGVTLLAPDLRGRGGSAGLPGPYGLDTQVRDSVAILDHLGIDRVVMAGHSGGGFISVKTAATHPDRVASLVLIDGGLRLPVPAEVDIDETLHAILGPAMQRLEMTFPTRDAYRDYWRPHPAFADNWNEVIEAYVDYDIHEVDGTFRSKVVVDAIREFGRDTLLDETLSTALPTIDVPMRFVWSPRGIMNADPLYPREVVTHFEQTVPNLTVYELDDVNHYTLALSRRGAKQVADQIRAAIDDA